jgi:chromosome segregation ATPase
MGFFDDIGRELDKALGQNNSSSGNISLVNKTLKIQKEFEETEHYLNQLNTRYKEGDIEIETYNSLKEEYEKKRGHLLEQVRKYQDEFEKVFFESESIVKRVSFEKSEISRNIVKLSDEFAKSNILEKEYKKSKQELEIKSKKLDQDLIKAKKAITQLEKVKPIFDALSNVND